MALPKKLDDLANIIADIAKSYDDFKAESSCGITTIVATKKNITTTARFITNNIGAYQEVSRFDANAIDREKRVELVKHLTEKGKRQTEIARALGISQATVSLDLKR